MDAGTQMILGLVLGITILIFLILKTKVHAFLALIIAAAVTGLVGGMGQSEVITSITKGFGNTMGSIGIIIGFGVMMGKILEVSGATEVMAQTFLRMFGKGKEEAALGTAGFITSLSLFCDSGFIILFPLAKALSQKTRKSIVSLGVALAGGLVLSHSLVPPASGPVGVAGIFGADVGKLMLWGFVIAIPALVAVILYAKYIGHKIYQIPTEDGTGWERPSEKKITSDIEFVKEKDGKALPSIGLSFAPIVLPILLIILKTIITSFIKSGPIFETISFLGSPIIALAIGLLIAIFILAKNMTKKETLGAMEAGIKSGGKLLLIIGGGGSLGMILRDSGVGNYVAMKIAATSLPAILLPFAIATLVRLIQGSGSVAMMTAASVTAPMLSTLNVDPVFAALACCVGSLFFSYFNDAYFWVINESLGIENVKEQVKVWSITSTIAWGVGLVMLLILNAFFG